MTSIAAPVGFHEMLARFDAGAFVIRHGGYKESKSPRSHEYLMPCPHCASSRLRWNTAKAGWQCWGCQRMGSTIDLIALYEGLSYEATLDLVVSSYNGGDAQHTLAPCAPTRERDRKVSLEEIAWPAGVDLVTPHASQHARAWQYLAYRGVSVEQALDWRLGFGRTGRLKDYLVFPVHLKGKLVYWQARATWDPPVGLTPEGKKVWLRETNYRKTLNPVADAHLYHATASDVLLNWDRASTSEHVVICEGPIDAIKVGAHAVALLGKYATPGKLTLLKNCRAGRYTVYLDRGDEERVQAEKLATELSQWAPVFMATPPLGRDAGALSSTENAEVVRRAVPFRFRPRLGEIK